MAIISGNGFIDGTVNPDLITGGAGGDTILGGGGNDTIVGGGGFDFAAYWSSTGPIAVQLFAGQTLNDGLGGQDQLTNIHGIIGSASGDLVLGSTLSDVLIGLSGDDTLQGLDGDDLFVGGAGNDQLDGGNGTDTVFFTGHRSDYTVKALSDGYEITDLRAGSANEGTDLVKNFELYQFADGTATTATLLSGAVGPTAAPPPPAASAPYFMVFRDGAWSQLTAEHYSGPVDYLQYQFLGSAKDEVAIGTSGNDFINLFGGTDAANGGDGNDVLDGGTGSNFLTGGAGSDVFFLDGRGGQTTWSTITDWQASEQLNLWGWRAGVSKATWVDHAGTAGYEGVTLHADINGDGLIDTSITWAGMNHAQLPTPIELDGLLWLK